MPLLLKKLLHLLNPESPANRDRTEKAQRVLLSELSRQRTDGAPVSHRRLESLMLASATGRRETVRLLRAIGARPSRRHGAAVWTLKGKP
ncbi:MAG: hypothetical protein JWM59_1653 [Verrucomicrobiales bacterium]|nr:hypothetical protein [Verrucomicrobiales bacterium]